MSTVNVVIVSDTQTGDAFGLWHPEYIVHGAKWQGNEQQEYLLKCWQDALDWLPKRIHFLGFNGDMTEGEAAKEGSGRVITPDPNEQGECAAMLVEPLVKRVPDAHNVVVIAGTPYHEGKRADGVRAFARALPRVHEWRSGLRFGWWCRRELDACSLDMSHEINPALVYQSTMLEREGRWARANDGHGKPILVIRSHVHKFHLHESSTGVEVIAPCWQIQTPYMIRKSPNKMIPDLGVIWIQITEGENAIRVLHRLYQHPLWHTE